MALRTQVGIVGAGPAGLLLSHMLHRQGIESIVLERHSRNDVEAIIKAGVLEQGTVDLMNEIGAAADGEGSFHHKDHPALQRARADRLPSLTGADGDDLRAARRQQGPDQGAARYGRRHPLEATVDAIYDLDTNQPNLRNKATSKACDFIAGCDGTQGVCRPSIPAGVVKVYERLYPFGWFGILCKAPPSSGELIYAMHERGFVLVSTRSPEIQRMYFQCSPTEKIGDWPDDKIWAEFRARLETKDGWAPKEGDIFSKAVIGMRSLVCEPMRYGRLFLAGDSAHVVPPTGAKGLNPRGERCADPGPRADRVLQARTAATCSTSTSATALRRIWKATRFSWWMTSMLHTFPDPMSQHQQVAELDYVTSSRASSRRWPRTMSGCRSHEPIETSHRMFTPAGCRRF
jgi:p-hydroxybenzoate 3-monooxygenase